MAVLLLIVGGVTAVILLKPANKNAGSASTATVASPAASTAVLTATTVSPAAAQVRLEPAASSGSDPFSASVTLTEVITFPSTVSAVASKTRKTMTIDKTTGGLTATGATPALYGGSNSLNVCDVDKLTTFLTGNPDKAKAWAEVRGISVADIPDYLHGLTPTVLLQDTAVTNYGYLNGRATPHQSVLQAGTAVLVDQYGLPVVRCACGNPLTAAKVSDLPHAELLGRAWSGYSPTGVVTVTAGTVQSKLTLVDVTTGATYSRPLGAVAPGMLVAATTSGIATSPDGKVWTAVPGSPKATEIDYGSGKLVVVTPVGTYPDNSSTISVSVDRGATWKKVKDVPEVIVDISFDAGEWVLSGYDEAASTDHDADAMPAVIYTSKDAATWSRKALALPAELAFALNLNSLQAGNGVWLAEAGGILGDGPVQEVWRSTNRGATWTTLDWKDPASPYLKSKGYGMRWVWTGQGWGAAGSQTQEIGLDEGYLPHARGGTSRDGATWTFAGADPDQMGFAELVWDPQRRWISVGVTSTSPTQAGTPGVYTSADLLHWKLLGAPASPISDVAVVPGALPAGFVTPTAPAGTAPATTAPATTAPVTSSASGIPETMPCRISVKGQVTLAYPDSPGKPTCAEASRVLLAIANGEAVENWAKGSRLADGSECVFLGVVDSEKYGYGEECTTPTGGFTVGAPRRAGDTGGGTTVLAPTSLSTSVARTTAGTPRAGDLGLTIPISQPACDGTGIVIVASLTKPASYAKDVQDKLNEYPGASYLLTENSCQSLVHSQNGNLIYAVYFPVGHDQTAVCTRAGQLDGAPRWLDNTSTPGVNISC